MGCAVETSKPRRRRKGLSTARPYGELSDEAKARARDCCKKEVLLVRRRSRKTLADILAAGCPDCEGRMLIAWSGLVCENGCGRLRCFSASEGNRLRRAFPHLVIECVPVSKMKLCLY